jgi:uncharacterized GH25 family protein
MGDRGRKALLVGLAAGVVALAVVLVRGADDRGAPGSGFGGAGGGGGVDVGVGVGPTLASDDRRGSGVLELAGVVVDASGAVVGGARITAVREATATATAAAATAAAAGTEAAAGTAAEAATAAETAAEAGTAAAAAAAADGVGSGFAATAAADGVDSGFAATATAADPDALTTTGPDDGRFRLRGLHPALYSLRIEAAGVFTAEVRGVAVPSDDVRIVVARRVAIEGTVTDGGQPMAGATVEIAGDSIAGRRSATTDATGAFAFVELPEGTFTVWAWHGDLAARAQKVPRLGAGPFAPVALAVEPAAIVVGHVKDRAGGGGIAAAIELRAQGAPDEAPRYARSGSDGVFRVEGVPHGRWTADAWSPGWVSTGIVELEAGRGTPDVELVAGGVIEGTVVDDQGAPVAGAEVRANGTTDDGARVDLSAAEVDAQLRRYSGWALGAPASATSADPLAPPPATDDPRFVPRGELGVLLGPIPYPPPPGARASRQAAIIDPSLRADAQDLGPPPPLAASPEHAPRWITGADGRFRITGAPRSTLVVTATAPGFAEAASVALDAAPGRAITGAVLAVSVGAILVGRVTDQRGAPVAGATVRATAKGADAAARAAQAMTDADGAYRLGPLTGTVTLVATAYAHGEVRVEVELPRPPRGARGPVEERRDLVLVVADAELVGIVEDRNGLPVRGATVTIDGGPAGGRTAVTDDAGFRIQMLPPGALRVRIDHPDYPVHTVDATTDDGVVHLALPWGGGLDGVVLDHHTGAPVGGVVVAATGPGGARDETSAQLDGTFALGPLVPGAWRVAIAVPGYLPVERTVDVPAGDAAGAITVRDVRLELERGALLGGMVRDRYGTRVAGATVTARRASGAADAVTARTDADGMFRLRDAPTGAIVVRAQTATLAGSVELAAAPGDEQLSLVVEVR